MEFGFSLVPTADLTAHQDLVAAAETDGLDLVGVQDHPYAPALVDTFALMPYLLAFTSRIRVFPDVASLPLRPAPMLAQASASLDALSGGRFELGLGAGANWAGIESLGVARLAPAAALDALAEAVSVLRTLWQPGEARLPGSTVDVRTGPGPTHPINIWIGSQGPKSLRLTGRLADGWAAPIPSYVPYEQWPGCNATIDEAARAAGRDPSEVLRMAQLVGTITDTPGDAEARSGSTPVRGTPDQWAALVARLATEQPFRTFVFWPEQSNNIVQVTRFAREVVPAARALLSA